MEINDKRYFKCEEGRGYIFISYHKPFPLLKGEQLVPVQAGSYCYEERKEGALNSLDAQWFEQNTIGDGSGDSISERNHEFCECTVLYWIWKNLDYKKLDYIGLFQYRRQLILNDYYEKAPLDDEKEIYRCVHIPKEDANITEKIGLNDFNIRELLKDYDVIIPYSSQLSKMKINSVYEDWVCKIPGVHVGDLVALENEFRKIHPEDSIAFHDYLVNPYKLMYQVFIVKPQILDDYCKWLFEILFRMDSIIDTSFYSINGKRTLGYLAEILYGFYFTKLKCKHRIFECGVTYLE
ncbi:MAG: DUF4422 domain-containing protein [Candidatus Methanomethylophilaceae archaeon]|nr:DUF4422 domain-containing protein [Candidatus Methanomethylophilaceae archaeon]